MKKRLLLLMLAGTMALTPATQVYAFEQIFAKCDEYINIRQDATIESDVIAKIYNHCEATLLEEKGEWIRIRSGNAEGWVKSEFFAFGEEAEQIAAQTAYNVSTVYPEALVVRCAPDQDAEEFGVVYANDQLEVIDNNGDWMTVAFEDGTYGYVSAYYVSPTVSYYGQAETLQEEEDRLNQEWLDYLAAQKAEEERLNREWLEYLAQQEAEQKAAEQAWLEAIGATQTEEEEYYEDSYESDDWVDESYEDNYVYNEEETYEDDYTYEEEEDYEYTDDETYYDADADIYYENGEYVEEEEYYSDYSTTGQSIVDYACQFVGNPYVWGGTSLTNGADCSGFVQSVFANFGIYLSRTAASQSGGGTAVSLDSIQAGDLLFYGGGSIDHVSIYMGDGQVVHASNSTDGIIISSYGYRTPTCARRYW